MILKIFRRLVVFIVLTALTQVGGIVYLANVLTYGNSGKYFNTIFRRRLVRLASFCLIYLAATFVIVPSLARLCGRVALPLSEAHHLRPLTLWTCLLNRHYVKPALHDVVLDVAMKMAAKHPGTETNYLDANFPFFNGFSLLPHLSHNDGKKLDVSFCYIDRHTGRATNDRPSPIGYGICEEPRPGEINTAESCAGRGYWQYSILKKLVPQGSKEHYELDEQRTRDLVMFIGGESAIDKIFIEPHLRDRLGLTSSKIRFHGCRAVRHDDHVHMQVR